MKIKYFPDTDTALFEFSDHPVQQTKEIDENIYIDFDEQGKVVGMTVEHARQAANIFELTYQQMSSGS